MASAPASTALYDTYARRDIAFARGEGPWVFTADDKRYLDFASGIAVNSLGHAHPQLVAALERQARALWQISNLYRVEEQEVFAKKLCAVSFADKVFVTNSGAEAMECAIKTARRYHYTAGAPQRYRMVTFQGAFHGRTLATLAAAQNPKHMEGFGPAVDGFDQVAPHADAVEAAITDETAAVLIEPVQGESGIQVMAPAFLRDLRHICDQTGCLLIFDEVQCGMGRTGKLFAYEHAKVAPDIMGIAKGIGGGFPLGACLASAPVAAAMSAGTHGSTFGGNPLACAVGSAVLDILAKPAFLDKVARAGLHFKQRLAQIADTYPTLVDDVRGIGLMMGLRMKIAAAEAIDAFFAQNLLCVPAGDNVVRLLPPLNVDGEVIAQGCRRIDVALQTLARRA